MGVQPRPSGFKGKSCVPQSSLTRGWVRCGYVTGCGQWEVGRLCRGKTLILLSPTQPGVTPPWDSSLVAIILCLWPKGSWPRNRAVALMVTSGIMGQTTVLSDAELTSPGVALSWDLGLFFLFDALCSINIPCTQKHPNRYRRDAQQTGGQSLSAQSKGFGEEALGPCTVPLPQYPGYPWEGEGGKVRRHAERKQGVLQSWGSRRRGPYPSSPAKPGSGTQRRSPASVGHPRFRGAIPPSQPNPGR